MRHEIKQQIEQAATDLNLTLLWQEQIQPGDLYLAARNSGPKLLTAQKVIYNEHYPHNSNYEGYVLPTTLDYPFDINECVKVKAAD